MDLLMYLRSLPNLAIAFSGGVDSAYLLYMATKAGIPVGAYYASSAFQPQFEKNDALRLTGELSCPLKQVEVDVLGKEEIIENRPDRCYHCKKAIFSAIWAKARADGFTVLCDGTNFSDDVSDRPGMRAIQELGVLSPLRECGLTKEAIYRESAKAGLFTAKKPSYACLATRIPTGTRITKEDLICTEKCENVLFELGFSDFRVRKIGRTAKLQVLSTQLKKALDHREEIQKEFSPFYDEILLDLKGREENGKR